VSGAKWVAPGRLRLRFAGYEREFVEACEKVGSCKTLEECVERKRRIRRVKIMVRRVREEDKNRGEEERREEKRADERMRGRDML
jgi:hypothetical protein